MAYAAALTRGSFSKDSHRYYVIEIEETEASSSTEFEISNVPKIGTIVLYQATLTAGTGSTIQPEIYNVTAGTADTQDVVNIQASAAANILDTTAAPYVLPIGSSGMFIKSKPNFVSGDHSISTRIVIREGI